MKIYLLLGSNLGDRLSQIRRSIQKIKDEIGTVLMESAVYETESWGVPDQPLFLNQAIVVETEVEPIVLLEKVKEIERSLGRSKRNHWQSREIDIDILFFEDQIINSQRLTIPHPHIPDRLFALIPLMELAPHFVHPIHELSILELYDQCTDQGNIVLFEEE